MLIVPVRVAPLIRIKATAPRILNVWVFLGENHLAVLEERAPESRPRILEQYHRVQHGAGGDATQFKAVVLANLLLAFSFMRDQMLIARQRQHLA